MRAFVLALAACWRNAPPPSPPAAPPPEPRPARVIKPPSAMDDVLTKLEDFAEQICACPDAACVHRVGDAMTSWSRDLTDASRQARTSNPEDQRRIQAISDRLTTCMENVFKMGSATP